ncbi:hypothetical protein GS425_03670 [Rhodococcus hoagii]|nr:hypothetical protein [Prescottella equi]
MADWSTRSQLFTRPRRTVARYGRRCAHGSVVATPWPADRGELFDEDQQAGEPVFVDGAVEQRVDTVVPTTT